jgi:hypothetical protein
VTAAPLILPDERLRVATFRYGGFTATNTVSASEAVHFSPTANKPSGWICQRRTVSRASIDISVATDCCRLIEAVLSYGHVRR